MVNLLKGPYTNAYDIKKDSKNVCYQHVRSHFILC